MNDLEERLKALRPIQAPRTILERARRNRRPWIFALAAAAAALAVTAFVVVSAPLPDRPDPASDYRSMVDRLLKAKTIVVKTEAEGRIRSPDGRERKFVRRTTLRMSQGNRLHAIIDETYPDIPGASSHIQVISDGRRTVQKIRINNLDGKTGESETRSDLRNYVVHWIMNLGELHPMHMSLSVEGVEEYSSDLSVGPAPKGYPATAKVWTATSDSGEMILVFDPAKSVLLGRAVKLAGGVGESLERILEFRVDEPLDDRLFVLPK